MQYLHLRIRGRVQGVGFRHFVLREACALDLLGTVRNLPDGSVEVEAEGDPARLRELLERAQRGPIGASVTGVEAAWGVARSRFQEFRIR